MKSEPKLRECPFCGGEAFVAEIDVNDTPTMFLPLCKKVDCHAGDDPIAIDSRAEAIEAWNTRANWPKQEKTFTAADISKAYNDGFNEGLIK